MPAGHLEHSLPSQSGWEQAGRGGPASSLSLPGAQGSGKLALLPCRVRHSEPRAGVASVLTIHLRGRTGTGTGQECPQTQVSLAYEQSGPAWGEVCPQPQVQKYCSSHSKRQWGCLISNPQILVLKAPLTTQHASKLPLFMTWEWWSLPRGLPVIPTRAGEGGPSTPLLGLKAQLPPLPLVGLPLGFSVYAAGWLGTHGLLRPLRWGFSQARRLGSRLGWPVSPRDPPLPAFRCCACGCMAKPFSAGSGNGT